MRKKISNFLGAIPEPILLMLLILANILDGVAVSQSNIAEASLTREFSIKVLFTATLCYAAVVVANFFNNTAFKTYKNKAINRYHIKYLDQVLSSKMVAIQKVSTGKVFDAVKDLAALKANMASYLIWMIPAVAPFAVLMYREAIVDWRMVMISMSSVAIGTFLALISDKLFGFNNEQKAQKAILQEITVDNFMNSKTLKYLGQKKFAINRLKKCQDETWDAMLRPGQVLYFRLVDIVGIAPTVLNVYLARNNIELIALILLSSWTLNNVRGNLINLIEAMLELKAQKDVIKDLKGDDKEVEEDFPGLTLNNVWFDYGKDSIKFNIDKLSIERGDRILVTGVSGEGKAEPYTNKIPTPTEQGYTLMGDLKIGDYVFDENGRKTKVTHIFEQGMRDIYRITFKDHRHIDVSDEHLFGLYHYSHGEYKYKVMSVRELYERQISQGLHCRYRVPHNNAVVYPKSYMPIHPWVLGCFIGNGCCRETNLTISAATIEVPQRIADICGFTVKRNSLKNYNWVFYKNNRPIKTADFFVEIPEMINCYSKDKRIPHSYMVTDIQSRYRLLQGLLDTDGNITRDIRHNVSYSSTSKELCEQILWLIRSLGFTGMITLDKRSYKYNSGFCGRVHFSIPHNVKHYFFSVSYKWQQAMKAFYDHLPTKYRYFENGNIIENIEKLSEKKQCRCIRVENPSHLYLTENFIVTHNSSLANLLARGIEPTIGTVPATNVYYVWQETECLSDTLRNNILFDNPYELTDTDLVCYLEKLGMISWFRGLKNGFDTQIGERGCKISSGQKQRINIIRTLIEMENNPNRLFIMDEITSNLDDETKRLALEAFKTILDSNPMITAIIISHNDGFDELCDRHIEVINHEFIERV